MVVARACHQTSPSQYTFAFTTYNCDLCFASTMVVRNGKTIITRSLAGKTLGPSLPQSHVVVALCLVSHVGFVSWTSQVIHKGRLTAANFQSGISPAESECSARHNEQTSIGLEKLGCRRIASLAISGKLYGTVENAPGFIQAPARPKIVFRPFPP